MVISGRATGTTRAGRATGAEARMFDDAAVAIIFSFVFVEFVDRDDDAPAGASSSA